MAGTRGAHKGVGKGETVEKVGRSGNVNPSSVWGRYLLDHFSLVAVEYYSIHEAKQGCRSTSLQPFRPLFAPD